MKTCVQSFKDDDNNFDFTLTDREGFEMSQPLLIDRIIKAINFYPTTTRCARDYILVGFPLLNKDVDSQAQQAHWKYHGLLGKYAWLPARNQSPRYSNGNSPVCKV